MFLISSTAATQNYLVSQEINLLASLALKMSFTSLANNIDKTKADIIPT